tara:strand:- start:2537 stop:3778 length:1242 start_codon:yes stop_codon:yes gene_type:complete
METKEIDVKFSDVTGHVFEFSDVRSLHEFLQNETVFWADQIERIDEEGSTLAKQNKHPFFNAVNTFRNACQAMDSWLPELANQSEDQLHQNVRGVNQQLQGLERNWLWSGDSAAHRFVEMQMGFGANAAHGFVEMALKKQLKIDSHEAFVGTLVGYEFSFQNSELLKRRNAEKAALSRLQRNLSKTTTSLIGEVEAFKSDFTNWESETRLRADRIYNAYKKLGERKHRQHDKAFQKKLHDWGQSIADLESTYEEKLRLEKPAMYWKNAADKYRGQGRVWAGILLVLLLAGLSALSVFFLQWVAGKELGLTLNSLQGITIFGTFGAVFAYLIRVVSRLAFSSFHLMRDAEEREQLTYLYLSLTKEAEMNKESRDLVLQALFSRTDSGLLSGDSSPTMPNASDALRVLSRTRSQQ